MSPLRFLIFDSFASVLWAGGYMTLGYIFTGQFERLATYTSELGTILVVVLIAAAAVFLGFKIIRGHGWLFSLRAAETLPAGCREDESQETRAMGA